jgi:hypothetical protein
MKNITTEQAIEAMEKKLSVIAVIEHKLNDKLNLRRGVILAVNKAPTEKTTTVRFVSEGEAWERPISRIFLDNEMNALNAEIEQMFIFAFAKGYQICSEKSIKAISDNSIGALNSGLFPDLARMSMKEFFNPPSQGEKEK